MFFKNRFYENRLIIDQNKNFIFLYECQNKYAFNDKKSMKCYLISDCATKIIRDSYIRLFALLLYRDYDHEQTILDAAIPVKNIKIIEYISNNRGWNNYGLLVSRLSGHENLVDYYFSKGANWIYISTNEYPILENYTRMKLNLK